VPEGSAGRVRGDEVRYNAVAAKIMKDAGVAIDDLHAVVVKAPHLQLPRNVHFTPEGYQALARVVADCIEKAEKP
jgi:acyl-CoA thioesterase-1